MLGERVGKFKSIDVYKVSRSGFELADTRWDEVLYLVGKSLFYKDELVASVASDGSVYDFDLALFERLKNKKKEFTDFSSRPVSKADEKKEFSTPIPTVDLTEVDAILAGAATNVDSFLKGFSTSVDSFLKEASPHVD